MTEAILLALWVGTSLFFILREKKARDDRESHEWWLSEVRECIHCIECEFQRNCKKIAEEELAQQRFSEYKYNNRIRALKEKYKEELTEKIVAQKRIHVTTVPEHLVSEYERNISDIADTFRCFGDFMSEQITRKEQ